MYKIKMIVIYKVKMLIYIRLNYMKRLLIFCQFVAIQALGLEAHTKQGIFRKFILLLQITFLLEITKVVYNPSYISYLH